jgi:predicted acyltransferase (DUF342 family)
MLLPLVPAMMEYYFPTDDKPIRVVQAHDGDIQHFAKGFGAYAENKLADFGKDKDSSETDVSDNNILCQTDEHRRINVPSSNDVSQAILSRFALSLPPNKFYKSEIYSSQIINAGHDNYFRAILGKDDVYLDEYCKVMRWVHSDGSLHVQQGCELYGRASATRKIVLAEGCKFERLQSARIEFGEPYFVDKADFVAEDDLMHISVLPEVHSRFERRYVVKGDFCFPDKSKFDGDVVGKANVDIGKNSIINGSIKSNGNFLLRKNSTVNGSVVGVNALTIEQGCNVRGPVISEHFIHIKSGSIIGTESIPTTVTAPIIIIESGAVIYGAVWASVKGEVQSPKFYVEEVAA